MRKDTQPKVACPKWPCKPYSKDGAILEGCSYLSLLFSGASLIRVLVELSRIITAGSGSSNFASSIWAFHSVIIVRGWASCKLKYIASPNLKGFVSLRDPHGKITTQAFLETH